MIKIEMTYVIDNKLGFNFFEDFVKEPLLFFLLVTNSRVFFTFGLPVVAWNKWAFGYNSLKNMGYSNFGTQSGFPE